jgi:hypothetical protein
MESQLEINEERLNYLEKINQELPDLMTHISAKWDEVYCPTLEKKPAPAKSLTVRLAFSLPQLNIFMRRVRWILSPHPTDEGSRPHDSLDKPSLGAVKALFWLTAAVGIGIMVAGLGG